MGSDPITQKDSLIRAVGGSQKSEGEGRGLIIYVMGIICPLGRNRVNWSAKD